MVKFPVMIGRVNNNDKIPDYYDLQSRYGYVPISFDLESWLNRLPESLEDVKAFDFGFNENYTLVRATPYMQRLGVQSLHTGLLHCRMSRKESSHILQYTVYDYPEHGRYGEDSGYPWEEKGGTTGYIALDKQLQSSIDTVNRLRVEILNFVECVDKYLMPDFSDLYFELNEYRRLCRNIKITQEVAEFIFQRSSVTPLFFEEICRLLVPIDEYDLPYETMPEGTITPVVDKRDFHDIPENDYFTLPGRDVERIYKINEDENGIKVDDVPLNQFLEEALRRPCAKENQYLVHNDLQMIYTIFDYLASHKIHVRRCEACQRIFFPNGSNVKYCSEECRRLGRIRRNRRSGSKNTEEHNFSQRLIKRYDKYHKHGKQKEFDLGCLHIPEEDMDRSVPLDLLESLNEERRKIISGLENVVYKRYNHRRFVQLINRLIQYQQKRRACGLIPGEEYLKWIKMSGRIYKV